MLAFRPLRAFALTLLLGAATMAAAHESGAYVQGLQDSLISLSASDFKAHGPRPGGFRNVDLRYRENDMGARSYMLCGQVRLTTGAKSDWVDFATIKTDPYEQWIGGPATDMCARAVPVSPGGKDLAPALQMKAGGNLSSGSKP